MSDNAAQLESPEGRLYAAGFTRSLGFWVAPGTSQPLSLEGTIAHLDSGNFKPPSGDFPDAGIRAFPDELVDQICPPPGKPDPPPWLLAQAEVIAEATVENLRPVIRAEMREALKRERTNAARRATP
jgi:hypothetical protein